VEITVSPPRGCLFALRTNCGFYRNRGELSLRGRIKEAAILYDSILLEHGAYHATISPTGSLDSIQPYPAEPSRLRELGPTEGSFSLNVRRSDSEGPFRTIMAGEVERRFHSEFITLAHEIAESLDRRIPEWISFVAFDLTREMESAIGAETRRDESNRNLWRRRGSTFLKSKVLRNLNHDLAASDSNTDVSVDYYFLPLLRRKAQAQGPPGARTLRVLVPNVASFSWQQIAEIREHPGVQSFRRQLSEIQEQATTERDIKEAVFRRTVYDLAEGWRPPGHIETVGKIALDMVLSLHPAARFAAVALDWREAEEKRATWGAVLLKVLEMAETTAV
jgi:hypothetical protein